MTLAALYARAPRGMKLGLQPMKDACAALAHPEHAQAIAHVAGTNGKGSVSSMIESIARAGGRTTGLYTSPHLCRFAERIRVNGAPIDDALLERVVEQSLAIEPELTFFECATLAAFLAFRERDVHTRVLEVGLGGRLDATNVIERPDVTVITRIAFDHMDKLGDSLAEIAGEKAGIVKAGAPLVLGDIHGEARDAIVAIARPLGAPITFAIEDPHARGLAEHAKLRLAGAHQVENAIVAAAAARILGATDDEIVAGLEHAEWPGRLEIVRARGKTFLLDAAHNPDGARALARYLAKTARPDLLVFGALADKAWREMLGVLAPCASKRVYVAPTGRAAAPVGEMRSIADGAVASSMAEALDLACATADSAVSGPSIVIAGSIYLVGEARSELLDLPRDPPVAL